MLEPFKAPDWKESLLKSWINGEKNKCSFRIKKHMIRFLCLIISECGSIKKSAWNKTLTENDVLGDSFYEQRYVWHHFIERVKPLPNEAGSMYVKP